MLLWHSNGTDGANVINVTCVHKGINVSVSALEHDSEWSKTHAQKDHRPDRRLCAGAVRQCFDRHARNRSAAFGDCEGLSPLPP